MAWGMFEPSADNDFWPNGEFVGYDEALKNYYDNAMTDAEKAKLGMEDRLLFSNFARKFISDLGPICEHEQPKVFQTFRTYKSLGSLITLLSRKLAVDERLREIIERLEPGVHQFWPLKISMLNGAAYPVPYYGMVIHNHLDAFRPDESDVGSWHHSKSKYSDFYTVKHRKKACVNGLAMSRAAIGSAHIWRERHLNRPEIFLSGELHGEITKAGLKTPKMFKLKDTS